MLIIQILLVVLVCLIFPPLAVVFAILGFLFLAVKSLQWLVN